MRACPSRRLLHVKADADCPMTWRPLPRQQRNNTTQGSVSLTLYFVHLSTFWYLLGVPTGTPKKNNFFKFNAHRKVVPPKLGSPNLVGMKA